MVFFFIISISPNSTEPFLINKIPKFVVVSSSSELSLCCDLFHAGKHQVLKQTCLSEKILSQHDLDYAIMPIQISLSLNASCLTRGVIECVTPWLCCNVLRHWTGRLHFVCLHWLFRTREHTEVRCDTGFSIDTFYVKQICYPFLPILGVLSGAKAPLRLLPLVIPYPGMLRYDMTLVLALHFLHKCMSILLPPFVSPFGVANRGKDILKEEPKLSLVH